MLASLRAKFLCWCSNRHCSVDFNTTVGTCSRGGASGGVDDVCASHWRKISKYTKPNESAVYKNDFQLLNCGVDLNTSTKILPSGDKADVPASKLVFTYQISTLSFPHQSCRSQMQKKNNPFRNMTT